MSRSVEVMLPGDRKLELDLQVVVHSKASDSVHMSSLSLQCESLRLLLLLKGLANWGHDFAWSTVHLLLAIALSQGLRFLLRSADFCSYAGFFALPAFCFLAFSSFGLLMSLLLKSVVLVVSCYSPHSVWGCNCLLCRRPPPSACSSVAQTFWPRSCSLKSRALARDILKKSVFFFSFDFRSTNTCPRL